MKHRILFVLAFTAMALTAMSQTWNAPTESSIAIDATKFPDENFRNWILEQEYGQDGVLTQEEIAEIM